VIEDGLQILQVDVAQLVEPEVVDGRRGDGKVVLLEADL
jgi:hypothetical protein